MTFGLAGLFADLTVAVEVGMLFRGADLHPPHVAVTTSITSVTPDFVERGRVHILQDRTIPPYVTVFKIHGPFLFGAADKLIAITDHMDALPPVVILRLRYMTAIDATGLRGIEDLFDRLRASGRTLILCGARALAGGGDEARAVPRSRRRPQHLPEHRSGAPPCL